MASWTIRSSSQFSKHFRKVVAEFKSQAEFAALQRSKELAAAVDKPLKEFEEFAAKLRTPAKHLRFHLLDENGKAVYSLVHGKWRCLYRVDLLKTTCTAISMDEMDLGTRWFSGVRRIFQHRL